MAREANLRKRRRPMPKSSRAFRSRLRHEVPANQGAILLHGCPTLGSPNCRLWQRSLPASPVVQTALILPRRPKRPRKNLPMPAANSNAEAPRGRSLRRQRPFRSSMKHPDAIPPCEHNWRKPSRFVGTASKRCLVAEGSIATSPTSFGECPFCKPWQQHNSFPKLSARTAGRDFSRSRSAMSPRNHPSSATGGSGPVHRSDFCLRGFILTGGPSIRVGGFVPRRLVLVVIWRFRGHSSRAPRSSRRSSVRRRAGSRISLRR